MTGYATGGEVQPAGTAGDDTIPAFLDGDMFCGMVSFAPLGSADWVPLGTTTGDGLVFPAAPEQSEPCWPLAGFAARKVSVALPLSDQMFALLFGPRGERYAAKRRRVRLSRMRSRYRARRRR